MTALDDLAGEPRWVAWRNEIRNGKATKIPYSPHGGMAKADNPSTWGTRPQATDLARQIVNGHGGGVGWQLGEYGLDLYMAGIDLDSCLRDGTLAPWAAEILATLNSYAEVSPSGTGVKGFFYIASEEVRPFLTQISVPTDGWGCRRDVPGKDSRDHGPAVEVYCARRYFAVTDRQWPDTPDTIRTLDRDDLEHLARLIPPPATATGGAGTGKTRGGDKSRSAAAFRKGAAMRRAGKAYDEMVAALLADPETAAWAREKGQANGGREFKRVWAKADPAALEGFGLTEDGVALAFAAKFKDQLRFCHHTGAWFEWAGTHWRREETKLAFSWARHTCRELAREQGASGRDAATMAKAAAAAAVERFAQADRAFAVTSAIWDRDPMLLGTPGGIVDLRTGKLRPAAQGDFITKLTAVAPVAKADCPLWKKFLKEATGDDKELIRFLQQWAGYCLTGDTREHALLFVYGPGGNGKTVWLNTISGILADYAKNAAMETFTAAQSDRHPTDLAMLKGARMVCASETEEGRAWAEVRLKQLTGGDTIAARFMRQDFFEFRPQFKLTVIGNHQPVLRNVGEAERRRFNVLPFIRKPAEPDKQLETKLQAEWPAILRWMIIGCLDWLKNGLIRPQAVTAATETYLSDQDTLRQWIDECCNVGDRKSDTQEALFKSWTDYALAAGEKPGTKKSFTQTMRDRFGFEPVLHTPGHNAKRGFKGVEVRPVDTSTQWQNRGDR